MNSSAWIRFTSTGGKLLAKVNGWVFSVLALEVALEEGIPTTDVEVVARRDLAGGLCTCGGWSEGVMRTMEGSDAGMVIWPVGGGIVAH